MMIIAGLIMMVLGLAVYNIDPNEKYDITTPTVRILLFGGSAIIVIGSIRMFF